MLVNVRIGPRLAIGFSALIALTIIMALVGIQRLATLSATTNHITGNTDAKASTSTQVSSAVLDMSRVARNILLVRDTDQINGFKRDYDANKARIAQHMGDLEKLVDADEERQIVGTLKSTSEAFLPFLDEVVELGMQNRNQEATTLLFGPRYSTQADYLGALKRMIAYEENNMREGTEYENRIYGESVILMIAIAAVAILIGGGLAWLTTRSVTAPIASAVASARHIAQGNLSIPIAVARRDEAGQLLEALKIMQANLAGIVQTARGNAEQVA
ncbi:MCP four helix bundle domain-containing protein, partial [Ralstonia pseudosolanacearum]|uniref:MCP four helix bundle domain-containing protein n=1 Tax=Ralstonia pseudosolanacearum TaxID=1310165 RepID=UPI003D287ACD